VLAAYGVPELRERIIARGLPKLTGATNTSRRRFLADMAKVRAQGFALDEEEYMEGGLCYAVPVFDQGGPEIRRRFEQAWLERSSERDPLIGDFDARRQ